MIGQYLSNTNESATVSISQNFSELNKAFDLDLPLLSTSKICAHHASRQTAHACRQHAEEENSVETANNYQDNRTFKCLQCRPSNQLDFYMERGKKVIIISF